MTAEDQIVECEKRLIHAMKSGDVTTLNELLHERLIFNIPSGLTITKQVDLESYRSGMMTVYDLEVCDQKIFSVDDLYIVAVTINLNAEYAGQIIDGKYRYLRVWKFTNRSWKVIAGSATQLQ